MRQLLDGHAHETGWSVAYMRLPQCYAQSLARAHYAFPAWRRTPGLPVVAWQKHCPPVTNNVRIQRMMPSQQQDHCAAALLTPRPLA